jgi:predicted enzyme related to lactoylglutathione lyase
MKMTVLFTALVFFMSCNESDKAPQEKKDSQPATPPAAQQPNKTPRVTGIGGIFFKCKDPGMMRDWYSKNLGLVTNDYGSLFEFRLADNPQEVGYLQWSPFSEKTKYFDPSTKDMMINYRVEGIEALVAQLKESGATVLDSIETVEYGKFVHLLDPEGNKIELWEPIDSVFTHLYKGKTTY